MPSPLVAPEVDLRDFPYMPLDVVRLRDSDLATHCTAEEFRCAVLLWCASWHQVPAGSLPDDDAILAKLAGFGRATREWTKHREGALHRWIKCDDGRLYHPTVAEKATEAWQARCRQRLRTEAARTARQSQRKKTINGSSVTDFVTESKGREGIHKGATRHATENVIDVVGSAKGITGDHWRSLGGSIPASGSK